MPIETTGAGRYVPASTLDFSRYAKDLAWLFECPLHFAREFLAVAYGFGNVHELEACLAGAGSPSKNAGPFDEPRTRPSYFMSDSRRQIEVVNELTPLSVRELKLVRMSQNVMNNRKVIEGRIKRRHYAVIDGAFFSRPAEHRKKFAEVKAGILAMECGGVEREAFLETNWPPAFWSYLEATQLLYLDVEAGLNELKAASLYYKEAQVLSIAQIYKASAVHKAPAIFLEMVGDAPDPAELELPDYSSYLEECISPTVSNAGAGLFDLYDDGVWEDYVVHRLCKEVSKELCDTILNMSLEELITAAPDGTPQWLLAISRKWRLHQLRQLSRLYIDAPYNNRAVSRSAEAFWPGSDGNTITELSDLVWQISRNAPSLWVYGEFIERNRYSNTDDNRAVWRFKGLITRTAPDVPEEFIGYMSGWLLEPTSNRFVCDEDDLKAAHHDYDALFEQGVLGFLDSYLPFSGEKDLVSFANSRWSNSVIISEIVFLEKYRKQGLMGLAFSAVTSMHQNAAFSSFPPNALDANFDVADELDYPEEQLDANITPPGVYMVPVPRENKRLQRYLAGHPPIPNELDEVGLDVFPFWVA